MMNDLKRKVDERLKNVEWTSADSQCVRSRITEKKKKIMKKKLVWVMVLCLALLMAATAVAAGVLRRSENNNAIALARQAVAEKYGLSAETLAMLNARSEKTRDGWVVTLSDNGLFLGKGLDCGEYTVTLGKDEPLVTWNGETEPGKGGQAEMRAYLEQTKRELENVQGNADVQNQSLTPLATPPAVVAQPEVVWKLQSGMTLYTDAEHHVKAAITCDEAKALLSAALMEEYGITEADFAAAYGWTDGSFRAESEEGFWPLCQDAVGKGYYVLQTLLEHDGIQLNCSGLIDAETGEILETFAESGGNG